MDEGLVVVVVVGGGRVVEVVLVGSVGGGGGVVDVGMVTWAEAATDQPTRRVAAMGRAAARSRRSVMDGSGFSGRRGKPCCAREEPGYGSGPRTYERHSPDRSRSTLASVAGWVMNRLRNCTLRPVTGLMSGLIMYAWAWAGFTAIGICLAPASILSRA